MPRKSGLGRGLDALIGTERPVAGELSYIPIDQIATNPRQPRLSIDKEELAELTDSIREVGVLQPLFVTYDDQNDRYTLVTGGRRLLAATQAGLQTVPAIIRQITEQQRLELALIENLQRADLSPLESAEAYRHLVDEFGMSHDEVAARVGKSRVAVTNTLRLLKLPEPVKKALTDNRISEGHARALLSLHTSEAQTSTLHTVLQRELNVRQTEELVPALGDPEQLFPLLSRAMLHPLLAGVMLAAILSAIMSTVSSQLLVAASAVSRDLCENVFGLARGGRASVLAGRIAVGVLGVTAMLVAVQDIRVVFWFVLFAWSVLGASFGPVLLLSLWTDALTRKGALAGMLTGSLVTVVWKQSGLSEQVIYELVPAFLLAGAAALIVSAIDRRLGTAAPLPPRHVT